MIITYVSITINIYSSFVCYKIARNDRATVTPYAPAKLHGDVTNKYNNITVESLML